MVRTSVVDTLRHETLAPQGADRMAQRFIQLADVSEILDISSVSYTHLTLPTNREV